MTGTVPDDWELLKEPKGLHKVAVARNARVFIDGTEVGTVKEFNAMDEARLRVVAYDESKAKRLHGRNRAERRAAAARERRR